MGVPEPWGAMIARARGLSEVFFEFLRSHRPLDSYTVGDLLGRAGRFRSDLKRLYDAGEPALSESAKHCIEDIYAQPWDPGDADLALRAAATHLRLFASEMEYHLRDLDHVWVSRIEQAFLHLNRLLVADLCVRRRWRAAFHIREPRCEKLGGAHLLSHGIWGFKVEAPGERTDLVLGTRIREPSVRERRAVDVLALTEWKLVRVGDRPADKFREARDQARSYSDGCLAGFELTSVRYCVTVGLAYAPDEADVLDDQGRVTYRHVHVSIQRPTPSQLSRRATYKRRPLYSRTTARS